MRAASGSASDNSATSCDRTATINSTAATINTGGIGTATAILIVWITIPPAIITTATGYDSPSSNDCSASNDRAPTIGGTAANCSASGRTASVGAPGPDQSDLTLIN
jgi:hypothetical protein